MATIVKEIRTKARPEDAWGSASVQVFAEPETRVAWISDLLPDERKSAIEAMTDQALAVMKRTLDRLAEGD
jgi:hypothetical protein